MEKYYNYMGGTNITFDGLKKLLNDYVNVDGTQMTLENWFKEIEVFETLIPNVSKVYVPYCGAEKHGIFKSISWSKFEIKHYSMSTDETEDWWYFEPHLIVELEGKEWLVYEYSIYEENTEVIHINKIEPQTVQLFSPKNRSLGFINQYEFNDIRIQIKNNQVSGYYCIYNGRIFTLDKDGRSNDWFDGFFDLSDKQLMQLI